MGKNLRNHWDEFKLRKLSQLTKNMKLIKERIRLDNWAQTRELTASIIV